MEAEPRIELGYTALQICRWFQTVFFTTSSRVWYSMSYRHQGIRSQLGSRGVKRHRQFERWFVGKPDNWIKRAINRYLRSILANLGRRSKAYVNSKLGLNTINVGSTRLKYQRVVISAVKLRLKVLI